MYHASVLKSEFAEASKHLLKEAPQSLVISGVDVAAFDIERIEPCVFDPNPRFGHGK
jgi:hypothetical protein